MPSYAQDGGINDGSGSGLAKTIPYFDQDTQIPPGDNAELPVNSTALTKPHRTPREVSRWIAGLMGSVLTFSNETFPTHFVKYKPYFDPFAWKQFNDFMTAYNYMQYGKAGGNMDTVVLEEPHMLHEAPVDGRYRWLYEVRCLSTFHQGELAYTFGKEPKVSGFKVIVQVSRVPFGPDEDSMIIDSWDVKGIDD